MNLSRMQCAFLKDNRSFLSFSLSMLGNVIIYMITYHYSVCQRLLTKRHEKHEIIYKNIE